MNLVYSSSASNFLCLVFRRQSRDDAGSLSQLCFCYGHSRRCSAQPGFSTFNIASTFANGSVSSHQNVTDAFSCCGALTQVSAVLSPGPEGWTLATAPEVSPDEVHFRWSPRHQDLEVISTNSRPVYLQAPGRNKSGSLLYFSCWPLYLSLPFHYHIPFSESCFPPLQFLTWEISC